MTDQCWVKGILKFAVLIKENKAVTNKKTEKISSWMVNPIAPHIMLILSGKI